MPDITALVGAKTILDIAKSVYSTTASAPKKYDEKATLRALVNGWGSILFELRRNVNRARLMIQRHDDKQQILFGIFSFEVSNALMSDIIRLAPAPRLIDRTSVLLDRLRRIDYFQRLGRPHEANIDPAYMAALGFAKDMINKGGIAEFNQILETAEGLRAYAAKEDEGSFGKDATLPQKIVESEPIDENEL
jgi:hypothetical protein